MGTRAAGQMEECSQAEKARVMVALAGLPWGAGCGRRCGRLREEVWPS